MIQKKKLLRTIILAVLIFMLGLPIIPSMASVALAEKGVIYKVNAPSGLRVREGAGTGYRVLSTLSKGTKVKHVSNGDGGWWLIETQAGKRGYVDPKYLIKSNSGLTTSASGTLMYINATGRVNIRKSASSKSGIRGRLRGGTVVKLLGTSGDWSYIEVYNNGNRGYISSRYLLKY